jgi:hypothetical protein
MPKTPPKQSFNLKTKVGPGSFKQPVWVWAIVGVGAYYIYARATSTAPKTTAGGESDYGYGSASDYGMTPSAAPYDAGGAGSSDGGYDAGTGYDASGGAYPESIPLAYSGGAIPVKVTVKRPRRRHNRNPKGTGHTHHDAVSHSGRPRRRTGHRRRR